MRFWPNSPPPRHPSKISPREIVARPHGYTVGALVRARRHDKAVGFGEPAVGGPIPSPHDISIAMMPPECPQAQRMLGPTHACGAINPHNSPPLTLSGPPKVISQTAPPCHLDLAKVTKAL